MVQSSNLQAKPKYGSFSRDCTTFKLRTRAGHLKARVFLESRLDSFSFMNLQEERKRTPCCQPSYFISLNARIGCLNVHQPSRRRWRYFFPINVGQAATAARRRTSSAWLLRMDWSPYRMPSATVKATPELSLGLWYWKRACRFECQANTSLYLFLEQFPRQYVGKFHYLHIHIESRRPSQQLCHDVLA
jgi:hypothetical protein